MLAWKVIIQALRIRYLSKALSQILRGGYEHRKGKQHHHSSPSKRIDFAYAN